MRQVGVRALHRAEDLSIVGIPGPTALRRLAAIGRDVRAALLRFRPDVVVSIDSPSFNLRLVRQLPFPRLHWVSPQVWAWRPDRVKRIARSVDALATLFPFEPALYRGTGLRAVFTGHPLMDLPWSVNGTHTGVALGSRASERRRLGPVFEQATRGLAVLEAVPMGQAPWFPNRVAGIEGLCNQVERALVCSGTATLQLAAMGIPMLAAYQTDRVTYGLGRRLVRLPSIVLPNLVLGRHVVPSVVQTLNPHDLRNRLERLDLEGQRNSFAELRYLLRPSGAVSRVAEMVCDLRQERRQ